jgi:succinate-semialdehyde dehydrogenase/glutarate-semialdehyde dehydrogenase
MTDMTTMTTMTAITANTLGLKRPDLLQPACLIDGEWTGADSGATLAVTDPATGRHIADVPRMGRAETERAIAGAAAALPAWRARTARERAQVLRRWADLMLAHQDDLGRLMTLEQGKPLAEARGEIAYAASFIEWFAEEAKRVDGEVLQPQRDGQRIVVLKQPIGVCAAITPWNFPAAMITRKVGPALAAGCTIVVKPAELTPLSAFALGVLGLEAGLPPGVLQIVTGDAPAIGAALCESDTVRKLSFTGSTGVGRLLMQQCAPTIKKLSLELGGNAPLIVFDDADLERAVEGIVASKFRNAGQTCVCANRIYVQSGIYEALSQRLVQAVEAMRVGSGLEAGVVQGPLIDARAVAKVREHIDDALTQGAQLRTGGKPHATGRHLLRAHGAHRRDAAHARGARRNLRPARAAVSLRHRRRSHRHGQRHGVRPCGLCVHRRPPPHLARGRAAGSGHGRHQHRPDLQRGGALRRREAVGARARRLAPRHRGLPGAQVPLPAGLTQPQGIQPTALMSRSRPAFASIEATAQEASRADSESARLVRITGTLVPSTMPAA